MKKQSIYFLVIIILLVQTSCQQNNNEEARSIQQKIRMADYRDSIRFESRWATRSGDILQAINETNPTIVHFSLRFRKACIKNNKSNSI